MSLSLQRVKEKVVIFRYFLTTSAFFLLNKSLSSLRLFKDSDQYLLWLDIHDSKHLSCLPKNISYNAFYVI